jgi:hypothetical protein
VGIVSRWKVLDVGSSRGKFFKTSVMKGVPTFQMVESLAAIFSLEISCDDLNGRLDVLMDFDPFFKFFLFLS